jgi:collagenase-like PrtC family protease
VRNALFPDASRANSSALATSAKNHWTGDIQRNRNHRCNSKPLFKIGQETGHDKGTLFNSSTNTAPSSLALELVCPVNNLATLKAAVDNGADCVRLAYRDTQDERCFAGRRFNSGNLMNGIEYAGDHGRKVMLEMDIASNDSDYNLEAMHGTNTLKLLPQLNAMGVRAVKVEALHYGAVQLAQVAKVWRAAIDECLENSDHYSVKPS